MACCPRALGAIVKNQYKELFENLHEPHKGGDELKTFFNINAGGGEQAINLQLQTFKALCEYADFARSPSGAIVGGSQTADSAARNTAGPTGSGEWPSIRIDLHIHLPENKTTREYENIIQDIARYIYGRANDDRT